MTSTSRPALFLLAAASLLPAADRQQEPYAVLAGTVFRVPGFALPGAQITITPDPSFAPPSGAPAGKKPKLRKTTLAGNDRGEFALRVPAVPMRYTVRVQRKGFTAQEKPATVSGEERIELSFELEPETKP